MTSALAVVVAGIPSPSQGTWNLGPLPVRAYALCILAGIAACMWLTSRRVVARGGSPDLVAEVAVWAVPFGIVGARLYHVVSSPDAYFGPGGNPVDALRIWNGGLGVWGAIALGALGAVIACRRNGVRVSAFADAIAPGLLLAQAVGRLGNWFNQELFGRPTDLPWGLQIDPEFRPEQFADVATFHPTFLYEMLWNLAGVAFLLWLERRYRIGYGRLFWAYVMVYTVGRVWIEALRIDDAERVLGLRLNIWTCVLLFTLAAVMFVRSARLHPGRQDGVLTADARAAGAAVASEESAALTEDAPHDAPTDEAPDDVVDGTRPDGSGQPPPGATATR